MSATVRARPGASQAEASWLRGGARLTPAAREAPRPAERVNAGHGRRSARRPALTAISAVNAASTVEFLGRPALTGRRGGAAQSLRSSSEPDESSASPEPDEPAPDEPDVAPEPEVIRSSSDSPEPDEPVPDEPDVDPEPEVLRSSSESSSPEPGSGPERSPSS